MDLNNLNISAPSGFWWQQFINSMFRFSSKRIINEPLSVVIEKAAKDAGSPIKLAGYIRYALGEGIEKEVTDFAAEVASVVNG